MGNMQDDKIDLGQKLQIMLDSVALKAAQLASECGVTRQAVYG